MHGGIVDRVTRISLGHGEVKIYASIFICLTVPKSSHRVMFGYIETKALMNFGIYIIVCPHIALIVLRTTMPSNAHSVSVFARPSSSLPDLRPLFVNEQSLLQAMRWSIALCCLCNGSNNRNLFP